MTNPATAHPRRCSRTAIRRSSPVALMAVALVACARDATSITANAASPLDTPSTAGTSATDGSANVLAGTNFYVDANSPAAQTAADWRASRPADAMQMEKIASQPQANWMGNWSGDIRSAVDQRTTAAMAGGQVPIFVAYDIPQRDCGGYSGANDVTPQQYRDWIAAFANGLGSRSAVIVLEPDALAGMDCLDAADQATRLSLLQYAIQTLRANGAAMVYLDAGNPRWQSASTIASRLTAAGIVAAQGFSLNVSNFFSNEENVAYGQQISLLTGGKHFIVDSGRNGLGPAADAEWCNPAGRALGTRPNTATGVLGLDAYLWIKAPGESDGSCYGAPDAGAWMPGYALELAERAAY